MKNFDSWNDLKKVVDNSDNKILFKEGEVWWVTLGLNIGDESYGKGENFRRPVIVFRKLSATSCICIPLTSKEKNGSWYYSFEADGVKRCAMMHQMRMLSTKRFENRMLTISESDFLELKNAVAKFYNILQIM
jgi:mRNA-degrading endonuclease toxin of MazEF toxin-antitoxin module